MEHSYANNVLYSQALYTFVHNDDEIYPKSLFTQIKYPLSINHNILFLCCRVENNEYSMGSKELMESCTAERSNDFSIGIKTS